MNESKLRDLVERLGALLRAEQRTAGLQRQLQPVHQDILHYLARCNRYSNTPAAVTDYLQITKGTASQTIQVLERRGLVLKQTDKDDGRVVRLRLSASGRRLEAELRQSASWEQVVRSINTKDLAATEELLASVLRKLQQRNDYLSFGQCNTCRYFRQESDTDFRCGLTGETLHKNEIHQICREHAATVA